MSTERQLELYSYGFGFFLLALPLLIVLLAARFPRFRSRWLRFCLGVLVPWVSVQGYDSMFIRPLSFTLARARGNMLYDGTGAGAAIFFVGFVVPALVALLALGIEAIIQRARPPSTDALQSNA